MYRRESWIRIILYAVIAICIAIGLFVSLRELLIPIVVLGTIFLLYKFPPKLGKYRTGHTVYKHKNTLRKSKETSKRSANLRVIRGQKKDKPEDDDDLPKYH